MIILSCQIPTESLRGFLRPLSTSTDFSTSLGRVLDVIQVFQFLIVKREMMVTTGTGVYVCAQSIFNAFRCVMNNHNEYSHLCFSPSTWQYIISVTRSKLSVTKLCSPSFSNSRNSIVINYVSRIHCCATSLSTCPTHPWGGVHSRGLASSSPNCYLCGNEHHPSVSVRLLQHQEGWQACEAGPQIDLWCVGFCNILSPLYASGTVLCYSSIYWLIRDTGICH